MRRNTGVLVVAILAISAVAVGAAVYLGTDLVGGDEVAELETFDDSDDFAAYVHRSDQGARAAMAGASAGSRQRTETQGAADGGAGSASASSQEGAPSSDDSGDSRVATTNVQVDAVDEPDFLKPDGQHFYYAAGAARDRWDRESDDSAATSGLCG